ncbi:MAG: right-handed parallel beta-helix repeat-containing protein [Bacteroidetes bacterium]|nr:right-handed parallel beta-helix repeat-containing protein [Bacteroidota bacterium]
MKLVKLTMRRMLMFILPCFFIFLISQKGECRILHVPAEYTSIQAAIVVSINGDTVLVDDGFYQEQVNFLGKNIVVTSRYILDHDSVHIYNTEINRNDLNEGVKFINGEGPSAQLIGFTISNCLWKAVWCKNSAPWIRNNIIRGNRAYGISLETSSATISDNEIHGYPDLDWSGPYDAIEVFNSGPVIERNFLDGTDGNGNVGAINFDLGVDNLPGVSTEIRENLIIGGIFGGLPDNTLPQQIHHNIFISGTSWSSAMNITECASNLKIFNNTVYGGSGIWIQGGNFPDIRNNIVMHTRTGIEIWTDTATIAFNDVWDCEDLYLGVPDQTGINGNISVNPGFRNPANGDYHFFCWSKCIDGGDTLSEFLREPAPNGGRINMGNYGDKPDADLSGPCIITIPENIDFGYIPVNQQKDSALIIVNAGHQLLNISGVSNSNINIFSTDYPGGISNLDPDDSLSLIVTFHPLMNKVHYSDSLLITSNSVSPGKIYLSGHTALGIDNNTADESIELYPVPVTDGFLTIKAATSWTETMGIEITLLTGEVVYAETIHPMANQPLRINTGRLGTGLYCLKIRNNSIIISRTFTVIND